MVERPQRKRILRRATVVRTLALSPTMVRVVFTGADLHVLTDLAYTDHYIKVLFPPPGADYAWPFDPEQVRAERTPEDWPVTRTYTASRWPTR
jgi:NADPH-dependent ferric siderophore reductase